ncbi:agmatine deiminase family protein [Elizabethkingia anophelis]|uniref:agmatine deiminase family protein n=1 Tax=Elizabethkingia anophelis TaxID=1117645 RepID=UPI00099AEAC2|nr:agmatine deiminase family protein [Elizabethkingia anophelis]MCT4285661.1 agmatine deiminase family protein [Elizabethkingia anophelis]MDV3547816.1 agmatine deiminase family protein [Elizabethkingia anophelis]MDV3563512.1 agmatine deiminase family protein [Elizabethkingia anophelis]MDV3567192.1 agmatine deiminase family protein [Elizabethkingia anophelis]MDV3625310.1 agmatine deiminase family protein [Elizabethkingia anophelis]
MRKLLTIFVFLSFQFFMTQTYHFPEESAPHEGTWLQWPHHHQHGITYRNRVEKTWIDMTKALQTNEKVHIIAYDEPEKERIIGILQKSGVSLKNVDFKIYPTDDVWVRDNGPLFVKDKNNNILIEDWGFNAWGEKFDFENCDAVPSQIGRDLGIKVINLNDEMVNEGGSVETDGRGVLMACKSSVISQKKGSIRNKDITQKEAEDYFKKYYGVSKVIWLEGVTGLDITDMHIDGFMKFINSSTMLTMEKDDLSDMGLSEKDVNTLYAATNAKGEQYKKVYVPATKNNVKTAYGKQLDYKGSYVNYYVANGVVLVPNYGDVNDEVANKIIQKQYPDRKVIGIDVRNLYENGGMVHCVTQQQPAGNTVKQKVKVATTKSTDEEYEDE